VGDGAGYGEERMGSWWWCLDVEERCLLAWEEELISKCASLLHNVVLQDNILDKWWWILDPIHGYSVKGTYTYLSTVIGSYDPGMFEGVW